jgi:hypothetical protein
MKPPPTAVEAWAKSRLSHSIQFDKYNHTDLVRQPYPTPSMSSHVDPINFSRGKRGIAGTITNMQFYPENLPRQGLQIFDASGVELRIGQFLVFLDTQSKRLDSGYVTSIVIDKSYSQTSIAMVIHSYGNFHKHPLGLFEITNQVTKIIMPQILCLNGMSISEVQVEKLVNAAATASRPIKKPRAPRRTYPEPYNSFGTWDGFISKRNA